MMAKQKYLRIKHHALDGKTGIVTVRICSVEIDDQKPNHEMEGPCSDIGIDHDSLTSLYGGDLEKWVMSFKDRVIEMHNAHQIRFDVLEGLKGKLL
jgi:hypothetical protein